MINRINILFTLFFLINNSLVLAKREPLKRNSVRYNRFFGDLAKAGITVKPQDRLEYETAVHSNVINAEKIKGIQKISFILDEDIVRLIKRRDIASRALILSTLITVSGALSTIACELFNDTKSKNPTLLAGLFTLVFGVKTYFNSNEYRKKKKGKFDRMIARRQDAKDNLK